MKPLSSGAHMMKVQAKYKEQLMAVLLAADDIAKLPPPRQWSATERALREVKRLNRNLNCMKSLIRNCKVLRALVKTSKLKLAAIAARTGLSTRVLSGMLQAERPVTTERLQHLLHAILTLTNTEPQNLSH